MDNIQLDIKVDSKKPSNTQLNDLLEKIIPKVDKSFKESNNAPTGIRNVVIEGLVKQEIEKRGKKLEESEKVDGKIGNSMKKAITEINDNKAVSIANDDDGNLNAVLKMLRSKKHYLPWEASLINY